MFKKAVESLIKDSGGSIKKIHLKKFIERASECFMYYPWNFWLGTIIEKNPLDLMILQEIMFEKKPDTIIECGTGHGGLAYYLATLMDLMNIDGKVITIDHHKHLPIWAYPKKDLITINEKAVAVDIDLFQRRTRPKHPKIEYIHSDCLTVDIPELGAKTMVVLDSDNAAWYVYEELEKFSKMVSIGQYIIVENTILQRKDGGPADAIKKFLRKNRNFVVDRNREKFELFSTPGGYLLRMS